LSNASDVETVVYELNRLHELLSEFEHIPRFRERLIGLIDHAAWEQLTTSMRGLQSTIRNLEGQVRRLP